MYSMNEYSSVHGCRDWRGTESRGYTMQTKYIAKLHNGQWSIFLRTGSRKSGYTDTIQPNEYRGTMHTACAIAEQLTRDLRAVEVAA